jgi:hypothetical protein
MTPFFAMFNNVKSCRFCLLSPSDHHFCKFWDERTLINITHKIGGWNVFPSCVGCSAGINSKALRKKVRCQLVALFRGEIVVEDPLGVFREYTDNAFLDKKFRRVSS